MTGLKIHDCSCSIRKRAVEVEEENSERASDTIKTINNFYHHAHTKTKRGGDSN